MKIDFGELIGGAVVGFILGCWLCSHAFNLRDQETAESCQKTGTVIIDHQVYLCSKKPWAHLEEFQSLRETWTWAAGVLDFLEGSAGVLPRLTLIWALARLGRYQGAVDIAVSEAAEAMLRKEL